MLLFHTPDKKEWKVIVMYLWAEWKREIPVGSFSCSLLANRNMTNFLGKAIILNNKYKLNYIQSQAAAVLLRNFQVFVLHVAALQPVMSQ